MYKLRGKRDGFNIGLTDAQMVELDAMTEEQFWAALKEENLNLKMEAKKDSASRYMGVKRNRGKWAASISVNGLSKYLGSFADEKEAADAYDAALLERDGEGAMTNAKFFAGDFSSFQFAASRQGAARSENPRASTILSSRSSRQETSAAGDGSERVNRQTTLRCSSSTAKRGSEGAPGKFNGSGPGKGKASHRKGKSYPKGCNYPLLPSRCYCYTFTRCTQSSKNPRLDLMMSRPSRSL